MDDLTTDRVVRNVYAVPIPILPPTPPVRRQRWYVKLLPSAFKLRADRHVPLPPPAPVLAPPPIAPMAARSRWQRFMFWIARAIFNMSGLPFWEKHLTTLFYGPRSQGKSLHQARTVLSMMEYIDALARFYPERPGAIVVSNQKFSLTLEEKYLGKVLFYWESIQQLKSCPRENCWKTEYKTERGRHVKIPHVLHDAYIVMDDAATIIPADGWQDLPRWFRKVFAQAGHNGVHVIANIQDPLSCDINFRRYVDNCFKFQKIMGNRRPEAAKPPVKHIWGIYSSREIPAEDLWMHGDKSELEIQEEKLAREEKENAAREAGKKFIRMAKTHWRRRFHLIRRRYTEIYDTLQNVPEYMPNTLEHIELKCNDPHCDHVTVRHRPI